MFPSYSLLRLTYPTELETEDYIKIFSIVPKVQKLNLRTAGQFKDEVVDYIVERGVPLTSLQLDAANLVSDERWIKLAAYCTNRLESLKLSWLDYSMDDSTFTNLAHNCPKIRRLKLKKCFRIGDKAIDAIARLEQLEHLTLALPTTTSSASLMRLVSSVGSGLRTLCLEGFSDADDEVLDAMHASCTRLSKLRFTENDYCTDAGFVSLFTAWANPPLVYADLSSNRSVDYAAPDGPEDPVGLASAGFEALINHSGSRLERLDIRSCRHISYETFSKIFNSKKLYPCLKDINISFLTKVDTSVVAGMFKSCPELVKLTAFGCFNVIDVAVPKGVALIGVPNAQDSIVQGQVDMDILHDVMLPDA